LFAHLPDAAGPVGTTPVEEGLLTGLPRSDGKTVLVLDLPKGLGAQMADALAQQGYRPMPLYNSCPPPKSSAYPAAEADPLDILSPTRTIVRAAVEVQPILDAIAPRNYGRRDCRPTRRLPSYWIPIAG
jgi:hypothetical protein